MNCKKIVFLVGFLAVAIFIFNFSIFDVKAQASTLTESQIQSILNLLRAFNANVSVISNVENALRGTSSFDATWCHTFTINLKIGDNGAEVTALQTALQKEGLYQRTINGTFDEYTASAVVGFQEKYAYEILAPWGLVRGTGFVGRTTREKLNELYGCLSVVEPDPAVSLLLSPQDGETVYSPDRDVLMIWQAVEGAEKYRIEVAYDKEFTQITQSAIVSETSWTATKRASGVVHYWRVRAEEPSQGEWSEVWSWVIETELTLNYLENQLASLSEVVSRLLEQVKGLLKD